MINETSKFAPRHKLINWRALCRNVVGLSLSKTKLVLFHLTHQAGNVGKKDNMNCIQLSTQISNSGSYLSYSYFYLFSFRSIIQFSGPPTSLSDGIGAESLFQRQRLWEPSEVFMHLIHIYVCIFIWNGYLFWGNPKKSSVRTADFRVKNWTRDTDRKHSD
jgi:hypothetical protein